MANQQHLSKAPIEEALIDIRVTLPKHTRELEYLAALEEKYREQYPDKKTITEFRYKVDLDHPETEEKTSKPLGFRYTSADNTQVIQASLNGFTFSRLPPYQDWPQLRAEAQRVWNIYSAHVQQENIIRVATRYINKFKFPPTTPIELDEYLHYVPVVPKALPQMLDGFFSQIVVPYETAHCMAIILQQMQLGPSERSVILDIDVFKAKIFADEGEAWGVIDTLREVKNLIFFDSITEKTVTLYK
jgi:uncharacterized protein (TIGR04255 family)